MKQPTKTQTGPLYPNLWAEAQYNAKPWAMANKINATEEVVVKIIWGKEPLYLDEAKALSRYLGRPLDYLLSPTLTTTDPKDPRQREEMQKAVEEMGKILEALVEPVTLAQYLEALDWMKSAKSTVQAEKTKRR